MAGYSNTGPKVDESEAVLRLILPQLDDFYNTKRTIIRSVSFIINDGVTTIKRKLTKKKRRGAMEVADVSVDGDHRKKKRFTILLNGILLVTKRKESCYILKVHISLSLSPVVEKSLPNPSSFPFLSFPPLLLSLDPLCLETESIVIIISLFVPNRRDHLQDQDKQQGLFVHARKRGDEGSLGQRSHGSHC